MPHFDHVAGRSRADLSAARETLAALDRPARIQALVTLWTSGTLTAEDWLGLFAEEWSSCADLDSDGDLLWNDTPFGLLAVHPGFQKLVMTKEELVALEALPDDLMLYRGCHAANKWGLCWTLDRQAAERTAPAMPCRKSDPPLLVTARARKNQVLALKFIRKRMTILAMRPRHVSTSKIRAEAAASPPAG